MSSEAPLVTVIMNCFNGAAYLCEAIDSVVAQTYPNWELVFYDNASTDESAIVALGYGERIRYFRGTQTIPLGAARNAALSFARGDLIAFLDTDDRWLPHKLEWQVAEFRANHSVAFVYTNFYFLYETNGRSCLGYRKPQPSGKVFADFLRYYPVNLQTVMVRREVLMTMSELFDPTLDVSEEYDVFIRLLHKSDVGYMDRPTAIYRVHGAMTSVTKNDRYPIENEYVLNKLRRTIPDLDRSYAKEVRYLEAKIGYWYAVTHMAKGERVLARSKLRRHIAVAPEFMVLFAATYFPSIVWRALLKAKAILGAR